MPEHQIIDIDKVGLLKYISPLFYQRKPMPDWTK